MNSSRSHTVAARIAEYAGVFLLLLALVVPVAVLRFVAADEAFYAIAAREVLSGKMLYRDFFYPQMPLLPYVYGLWMNFWDFSWISGRMISAVLAAGLAVMLYGRLLLIAGRRAACAGAILFVSSGLVLAWYGTIKTFALSTLLLFAAYLLAERAGRSRPAVSAFFSGVFLGLAVDVRLFLVVAGLGLLAPLWEAGSTMKHRATLLLWCALGCFLALMPNLVFLLDSFDCYWFNNIGYHLLRSDQSPSAAWSQKLETAAVLLGVKPGPEASGYQFLLLSLGALGYAVLCLYKRRSIDSAVYIAALLCAVNFTPTPAWIQYFAVVVPFLIVPAVLLCTETFCAAKGAPIYQTLLLLVILPLGAYYLAVGASEAKRYTVTGENVIGVSTRNLAASRLTSISIVSKAIDQVAAPGEPVIAQWPGYLLESHAVAWPGMENQFWVRVENKITTAELDRYHVMSWRRLYAAIKSGDARVLVMGRRKRKLKDLNLESLGYTAVEDLPGVIIYSNVQKSLPITPKASEERYNSYD